MTLVVKSGITPPSVLILYDGTAVKGRGDSEEFVTFQPCVEDCAVRLHQGNDAFPRRPAKG